MTSKKVITKDDIMPMDEYIPLRKDRKRALSEMKRNRRVSVGPYATFYFENYETMLHQVQEMLYIERGGDEQLVDELEAYNPLIPQGNELVATVMFEIDDADVRHKFLSKLGGVEETMTLSVDGEKVAGVPETDVDRTNAAGKASSVQFLHFPMTAAQATKFKAPDAEIIVGIHHPQYGHMCRISPEVRAALAEDLD